MDGHQLGSHRPSQMNCEFGGHQFVSWPCHMVCECSGNQFVSDPAIWTVSVVIIIVSWPSHFNC